MINKKRVEKMANETGIKHLSDWYNVKRRAKKLKLPLFTILTRAYPDHDWHPWKFDRVPTGFWQEAKNQKHFFSWLSQELNIQHSSDWYRVKLSDVTRRGGAAIMAQHHFSLFKALSSVYNNVTWDAWKFSRTPLGYHHVSVIMTHISYWKDMKNQRLFFEHLEQELHIQSPTDWYKVTKTQLVERHATGLLKQHHVILILVFTLP